MDSTMDSTMDDSTMDSTTITAGEMITTTRTGSPLEEKSMMTSATMISATTTSAMMMITSGMMIGVAEDSDRLSKVRSDKKKKR